MDGIRQATGAGTATALRSPSVEPAGKTSGGPSQAHQFANRFYSNVAQSDVRSLRALPLPALSEAQAPPLPGLEPEQRVRVIATYQEVNRERLIPLLRQDPALEDRLTQLVKGPGNTTAATAERNPNDVASMVSYLRANFDRLDTDKNGYLKEQELVPDLQNPRLSDDQAAVVATTYRSMHFLSKANDEWLDYDPSTGVDKRDLQQASTPEGARRLEESMSEAYERPFSAIAAEDRQEVKNPPTQLFEGGTPDWKSVKQDNYGTCYFLAAIVGKAKTNPQAVKDMIAENKDGTYTVTFAWGDKVTVQAPTRAEQALASRGNGLWVPVLEKAWGQWRLGDRPGNPYEAAGTGAKTDYGVRAVTGHETEYDDLTWTSRETTRNRLESTLQAGRIVTAGINGDLLPFNDHKGLVSGHAYSVLAYDREKDLLTLRNPWARREIVGPDGKTARDGKDDGIFTLTMDEFQSLFSQVAYEKAAELPKSSRVIAQPK